jgi:hypothetical protein
MTGIARGRMSDAVKAEIERLCEEHPNWTANRVAGHLKPARHPATVAWFMITRGLISRKVRYYTGTERQRVAGTQHYFTEAQDRRLLELRRKHTDRGAFNTIAAIMTKEFGIKRTQHVVRIRTIMLSAYEHELEGVDG